MNLSFKEKSIWISLITTIIVFGYYFARVFGILNQSTGGTTELIVLYIGVVIFMVILVIVSHILLAIIYTKEANDLADERDKLIELKATKSSYLILVVGVFGTVGNLLTDKSPIMTANIILLFFVLAEIVGDSIKLYYYRKGV